ncbi:MAG: hypothetical protein AB1798_20540, partial [Spirochaetota bacterium]
ITQEVQCGFHVFAVPGYDKHFSHTTRREHFILRFKRRPANIKSAEKRRPLLKAFLLFFFNNFVYY